MEKAIGDECADVAAEVLGALVVCDDRQAARVLDAIVKADQVFLTGQGRTGLIARAFAMRLMHLGLKSFVVGDATAPAIGPQDLLVACSGSGQTRLTLTIAEQAKRLGARVVAIVGQPQCPLAEVADITAAIGDLPPEGAAARLLPLASVFELALFIYAEVLQVRLMRRLGVTESEMHARHANLE